jgi:hypothetical protein
LGTHSTGFCFLRKYELAGGSSSLPALDVLKRTSRESIVFYKMTVSCPASVLDSLLIGMGSILTKVVSLMTKVSGSGSTVKTLSSRGYASLKP